MFLRLNENDNCLVALENVSKGFCENGVTACEDIPAGHKIAACDIKKGENVIKYGQPIGHTKEDVCKGKLLHNHNVSTNLGSTLTYSFSGDNKYNIIKKRLFSTDTDALTAESE